VVAEIVVQAGRLHHKDRDFAVLLGSTSSTAACDRPVRPNPASFQSRADVFASAKQVKTRWEMQTLLGRRIFILVNFGLFLTVPLTRPVTRPHARD
jgi:hypothetical protein